jgi:hypothetical protein
MAFNEQEMTKFNPYRQDSSSSMNGLGIGIYMHFFNNPVLCRTPSSFCSNGDNSRYNEGTTSMLCNKSEPFGPQNGINIYYSSALHQCIACYGNQCRKKATYPLFVDCRKNIT